MDETSEIDLTAFDAAALRVARSFRGLSVSELAEEAGVSRQIVSSIENGSTQPFRPMLLAIADALRFPLRFFFDAPVMPERGAFHFRRGARVPQHEIDRARAHAALFGRVTKTFGSFAKFSRPRLPKVAVPAGDDGIEVAAEKFRTAINFRLDTPIANCIRAAEAAGVFVGTFDAGAVPVHGFACASPVLLLMLKSEAAWSRRRFSTMHEIGHLMMHTTNVAMDVDVERQADRFAGAVLVPRQVFWREFPRSGSRHFDWAALIAMKQRWGVSIQALIHRAYDLGLINAVQYRTANIHITKNGWRTAEPAELQAEEPEMCVAFIEQLRKRSSVASLCSASNLTAETVGTVLGVPLEEQIDESAVVLLPRRSDRQ